MNTDHNLLSIGKAALLLGVSIDTLRNWDADGKLSSIRLPSGQRRYQQADVQRMKEILALNNLGSSKRKRVYTTSHTPLLEDLPKPLPAGEILIEEIEHTKPTYPGLSHSALTLLIIGASLLMASSVGGFVFRKQLSQQSQPLSPVQEVEANESVLGITSDYLAGIEQRIYELESKGYSTYLPTKLALTAKNIVKNPSFEAANGVVPRQWSYTLDATQDTVMQTPQGIHSGFNGLKFLGNLSDGKGAYLGISQPQTITTAQRNYAYSVFLKYTNISDSARVRIGFWDAYNNKYADIKTYEITGTKDWYRIGFTTKTTGLITDHTNWYPVIEVQDLKDGVVYIDDVQLEEGSIETDFASTSAYPGFNLGAGEGAVLGAPNGDIYPAVSGYGALGRLSNRWEALYLNNATIDKDGNITAKNLTVSSGQSIGGDLTVNGTLNVLGNITQIRGVSYSFPLAQGASNTVLQNDGSGNLTWTALAGGSCTDCFVDEGNSFGSLAVLGTNDSNDLAFETGGIERFRIDTNGNVGIGRSSPSARLDIRGAGNDFNTNAFRVQNAAGLTALTVSDNGNVGIGTTAIPAYSLEVGGVGNFQSSVIVNAASGAQLQATNGFNFLEMSHDGTVGYIGTDYGGPGGNRPLSFRITNNEAMRIDTAGNIGIGTSAPGAIVDISKSLTSYDFNNYGLRVTPSYNFTIVDQDYPLFTGIKTIIDTTNIVSNVGPEALLYGVESNILLSNANNDYDEAIAVQGSVTQTTGTAANGLDMYGGYFSATNAAASTVSTMYGLQVYTDNQHASGTVTRAYGLNIDMNASSGTVTDAYGLYIQDIQGTNQWSIYQAGATDKNYFAGSVGIGTTAPTATLEVAGGVKIGYVGTGLTAPTNGLFVQGNVGIGTSAASEKLTLEGGMLITDFIPNLRIRSTNDYSSAGSTVWIEANNTADDNRDYRIASLRTASGASTGSSYFLIGNQQTGGTVDHFSIMDNNDVYINRNKSGSTNFGNFLVGNGNVGIGTTAPISKFAIAGLGSSTGTTLIIDSNGDVWRDSSSLRYKENVQQLSLDFSKLLELSPVSYTFKQNGGRSIGYIAEELDEKGLTDLVMYDAQGRPDAIKYDRLSIYLLEILKGQQQSISQLQNLLSRQPTGEVGIDNLEQLTERVRYLEDIVMDTDVKGVATGSATIADDIDSDAKIFTNDVVAQKDLNVLGKLTTDDLGITGSITAGVLSITGDENSSSISTLTGPLKLQEFGLGNLDIMAGKVIVDQKGTITLKEGDLEIEKGTIVGNDKIRGIEVEVEEGKNSVTISFPEKRKESKYAVAVSTSWETGNAVKNKTDNGFTVTFTNAAPADATFDWIVID